MIFTMRNIFLAGVSLGANNCPVIVKALNGHRQIGGIFGFQASIYGAKEAITPNCAFAHEAVSDNPLNFGLGAHRWTVVDPKKTTLQIIQTMDLHPGDWNLQVQDAFLADMKRIGVEKSYLFAIYGMFGHVADPVNLEVFLRRAIDIGVNTMHSPYRDYQTQLIVDQIMALPK